MRKNVENKKVTVLGAARSGIAAAKLLQKHHADVFVSDSAPTGQKQNEIAELEKNKIEYEFGVHSDRAFDVDFVVLSPGIPYKSNVVQRFVKAGIPVYSEIEIASWFCRCGIIAVTGSNGKTTTTTLIGEMLKQKYPDAVIAGNIGQPFSAFVEDCDEKNWAVVEVSSFQLETIDTFHPDVAVILNFAPNHLDRYDSYDDYLKAKWRITKNLTENDVFIYNLDDIKLSEWANKLNCRKSGFDINHRHKDGACFADNSIYISGQALIEAQKIGIRGKHNIMNAMAAALAAGEAHIAADDIRKVLTEFRGVEHRLEFVGEINGVKYVNDSKATTVESLSYALQSFREPIILIAGGKDKGSDFTKLNDFIDKNVRDLVLIGQASEKMAIAWQNIKPIHFAGSLDDAVNLARNISLPGDVILLSPACASFDMFRDFEDRGRQFKTIVNKLKGD
ncbi:MAG: UDP-N-acetylmuramoyl-L-alanine--D-glutamate ligase [Calditrichaceae bacterium]